EMLERNLTSYLMARATIELPFENVNFEFYKNLHKYVFGEIYDWAGTIRKVDISKSGTKFCLATEIEAKSDIIFDKLKAQNYLKGLDSENFINEFVDLYCALNYLHPFREGNGRIQRLFLLMLLNDIGKNLNFADIDKDLLMIATIKSAKGDLFMLRDIFTKHIN
ncbi:MAG: Fic family protein, partial [Clostridia bacterium]|nr:Fic family protein [Clostridia bacterium]